MGAARAKGRAAAIATAAIATAAIACGPTLATIAPVASEAPAPARVGAIGAAITALDRANAALRIVPARVPGGPPADVAWSPDGRWIAVLDDEGALAVLDAGSGAIVLSQRGAHGSATDRALAWSEDGARLAWSAHGGTTKIGPATLDVASGTIVGIDRAREPIGRIGALAEGIAWIEDARGAAVLAIDDARGARPLAMLEPPSSCGVVITGRGDLAVCEGSRVTLRDRASGALRGAIALAQPPVGVVAAGDTVATLDRSGAVHLLAADGRERASIAPRERRTDLIAISHDGRRVALASRVDPSGAITIHDAESGAEIAHAAAGATSQVAPSSDGAQLIAHATRGALVVRALAEGAAGYELDVSSSARFALSPDERAIAIAQPGSIRIVDRATGDLVREVASAGIEPAIEGAWVIEEDALSIVLAERAHVVAWSPGRAVVSVGCRVREGGIVAAPGGALRWVGPDELCDLRAGTRTTAFGSLRPSPDGRAVVDVQRALRVRDGASGEPRAPLASEADELAGCTGPQCAMLVALADDAARVAIASAGTLRVWDGRTGGRIARAPLAPARSIAMTRDGAALLVVDEESARVLDPRDLHELAAAPLARSEHAALVAADVENRSFAVAGERELVILPAREGGRAVRARVEGRTLALEARPGQRLVRRAEDAIELRSAIDGAILARVETPGAAAIDRAGSVSAACEDGTLRVRAVVGGEERSPAGVPCQAPRAIRFVAGDRAIVIEDLDAVRVVRARDGAWVELRVIRGGDGVARALVAASDGRVEADPAVGTVRVRAGGLAGSAEDARREHDLLGELVGAL